MNSQTHSIIAAISRVIDGVTLYFEAGAPCERSSAEIRYLRPQADLPARVSGGQALHMAGYGQPATIQQLKYATRGEKKLVVVAMAGRNVGSLREVKLSLVIQHKSSRKEHLLLNRLSPLSTLELAAT